MSRNAIVYITSEPQDDHMLFFASLLPIVVLPTAIIPVKVRFFSTLYNFYDLIFHKYVLFIEFKLILKVCNLNTIENKALETRY